MLKKIIFTQILSISAFANNDSGHGVNADKSASEKPSENAERKVSGAEFLNFENEFRIKAIEVGKLIFPSLKEMNADTCDGKADVVFKAQSTDDLKTQNWSPVPGSVKAHKNKDVELPVNMEGERSIFRGLVEFNLKKDVIVLCRECKEDKGPCNGQAKQTHCFQLKVGESHILNPNETWGPCQ